MNRWLRILGVVLVVSVAGACSEADWLPTSSTAIPPDAVTDARLAYDASNGDAVLTWTAPSPRGGTTALARYEIRTAYGDFTWQDADPVPDPPVPTTPDRTQHYRVRYPVRGEILMAEVRSVDASGNVSAPGNVAALRLPGFTVSGHLIGAISGEGVAGLTVLSSGDSLPPELSAQDGGFVLNDLAAGDRVVTAVGGTDYFTTVQPLRVDDDMPAVVYMAPRVQSVVEPSTSIILIFDRAVRRVSSDPILRKWVTWPVPVYVPDLVNSYGIDYGAAARNAVLHWNAVTQRPLFTLVASAPAYGITMYFKTPAQMGIQNGITAYTNDPDGTPARADISVVDSFSDPAGLRRVLLHELGHGLQLRHLAKGYLMYAGQPLPNEPTADEIWIVQMLYGLPPGFDTSVFQAGSP